MFFGVVVGVSRVRRASCRRGVGGLPSGGRWKKCVKMTSGGRVFDGRGRKKVGRRASCRRSVEGLSSGRPASIGGRSSVGRSSVGRVFLKRRGVRRSSVRRSSVVGASSVRRGFSVGRPSVGASVVRSSVRRSSAGAVSIVATAARQKIGGGVSKMFFWCFFLGGLVRRGRWGREGVGL